MKLLNVKNIIFDLGGVILNVDYRLTIDAFAKLGIKNAENLYSQKSQISLFDKIEKGLISEAEFRNAIRRFTDRTLTDKEIDDAWYSMVLDLPVERLNLLKEFRVKYRTFLLSNTNEIHLKMFFNYLKMELGIDNFADYFEKTYYSSRIHLKKPDLEVFELILKENNLLSSETIFLDDSIQHIEGAKKLGINAILINGSNSIFDIFDNLNSQ